METELEHDLATVATGVTTGVNTLIEATADAATGVNQVVLTIPGLSGASLVYNTVTKIVETLETIFNVLVTLLEYLYDLYQHVRGDVEKVYEHARQDMQSYPSLADIQLDRQFDRKFDREIIPDEIKHAGEIFEVSKHTDMNLPIVPEVQFNHFNAADTEALAKATEVPPIVKPPVNITQIATPPIDMPRIPPLMPRQPSRSKVNRRS